MQIDEMLPIEWGSRMLATIAELINNAFAASDALISDMFGLDD